MTLPDREQRKTLRVALCFVLGFAALYLVVFLCSHLPKPLGTFFGLLQGYLMTPLIMEPLLAILAFTSLILLNHYRRKNEGPDFVELPVSAEKTENLPQPLTGEELIAQIEAAYALGDENLRNRLISQLPPEFHELERIIALRLRIAQDRMDANHIRGLSRKLRLLNPQHPALN